MALRCVLGTARGNAGWETVLRGGGVGDAEPAGFHRSS